MSANWPLLAIDVGTTSIKGAVVDPDRLRLEHIQHVPFPEPLAGLPALFCEIDPGQIVAAVRGLILALLADAPNCAGLVMCGQMGGLVLTSAAGAPLSNYISWRDQRLLLPAPSGGTYFDALAQRLSPADRRQLGHEVRPGLPLSYLFWFTQAGQLPPGAIAANLPDFVLANLCGARPATELTQATGALNLETRDWHTAVFAKLGLEPVAWPRLQDLREPVGQLALAGQTFPCFAPVGDHPCALAGAFLGPGELSLNISTGSQVSRLTPQLALGDYQTRPFFDGQYLNTITHIPAGRSLNVLLGLLAELPAAQGHPLADPWAYIEHAVAAVAAGSGDPAPGAAPDLPVDANGLSVDLAFFPGPLGERGAITNIREGNLTVGALFDAAFRSMADNYQTCALRLAPQRDWHTLVFSGGLAQKLERLRALILARLPGPSRLCASSEDTLLGLLALARVVSGREPTVAAAIETLRGQELALA